MSQVWTNNAASKLASGIASGATSLTVLSGQGALFPNPTGGNTFQLTLVRASDAAIEIVTCTARSTDTLTVTRAQEGTTALTLVANDAVALRITALWLTALSGTFTIAQGGTNGTSFTAPASGVAPLVYFDGTRLNVDSTPADAGYNTSTNTLTSANLKASGIATLNSMNMGSQTVATSGGNTTLTSASPYYTLFTGTNTQSFILPDATTLVVGQRYSLDNNSTGAVTIKTNGGATLWTVAPGADAVVILLTNSVAAGTWETEYSATVIATGKVLSVSNSLTFAGTDGTTLTFPSSTTTIPSTGDAIAFAIALG